MNWTTTRPADPGLFWWLPNGREPTDAVVFELWRSGSTLFADMVFCPAGMRMPSAREVEKIEGGLWAKATAPPLSA